jgi:hypothetical protein
MKVKPELKQDVNGAWYVVGDIGWVTGNVGYVEGYVNYVRGNVGLVGGDVRAVLGDVLYNVVGTVKGTIDGREWNYVEERNDEQE